MVGPVGFRSACDRYSRRLVVAAAPVAALRGADLYKANLSKANLSGADLSEANYDDATRWPEGFEPGQAGARKKED